MRAATVQLDTGQVTMNIYTIVSGDSVKAFEPSVKKDRPTVSAAPVVNGLETVEISASSTTMQKIMDKINKLPDVRIPLVEEIRSRIKKNDYPLENRLLRALEKMKYAGLLEVE